MREEGIEKLVDLTDDNQLITKREEVYKLVLSGCYLIEKFNKYICEGEYQEGIGKYIPVVHIEAGEKFADSMWTSIHSRIAKKYPEISESSVKELKRSIALFSYEALEGEYFKIIER